MRYYPKADSVTQDFDAAYPGSPITPRILLLHSTEGSSWPDYGGGASAPHLTVMIDQSKARRAIWRQHYPFDRNSRALVNKAGGVETNRLGVIQVEIIGTSGWASKENANSPYVVYPKMSDLPDWFLLEIAQLWAWLNREWGVPLTIVEGGFKAWNAARPTMSDATWQSFSGLCGHQHVPENTHTDPGLIDASRILWHAKNLVAATTPIVVEPPVVPDPEPEPEPTPEPELTPEPEPTPEPPPPPPAPEPTKDTVGTLIRRGDRGEAVKVAQQRLSAHGVATGADGVFGANTEANVKFFQAREKLEADGVVGPDTWTALLAPTMSEMKSQAKTILAALGWRVNTDARLNQAIKDFQRMWNLGAALSVDGVLGPKTMAALKISSDRQKAGKGNISANFNAKEFQCKCGGKYADCRRIWAHREVVIGAENYRKLSGPFTPLSACRCTSHNKAVNGYYLSAHTEGLAIDVKAVYSLNTVRGRAIAPAIGYNGSNKTVRHLDWRHLSSRVNVPKISGSKTTPYTFVY